jgi:hypothetical protein
MWPVGNETCSHNFDQKNSCEETALEIYTYCESGKKITI